MLRKLVSLIITVFGSVLLCSSIFWFLAEVLTLPLGIGVEHSHHLSQHSDLLAIVNFGAYGFLIAPYLYRFARWIEGKTIKALSVVAGQNISLPKTIINQTSWSLRFLNASLIAMCAWRFGISVEVLCAIVLIEMLLMLAYIDARTMLLPDLLTIPLILVGLLVNAFGTFTHPIHAVYGAMAGYLALWLSLQISRLRTGQDGLGYGDIKLMAALGSWLGVETIPLVLAIACILGLCVGLHRGAVRTQELPFGPCLAIAGLVTLFLMPEQPWNDMLNLF